MLRKMIEDPQKIAAIGVWANELIPTDKDRWRTNFPHMRNICGDGCATCKPAVMKMNNRTQAPTMFIGDGLSDRFAAQYASVVFAKHKLAEFCRRNHILHDQYANLKQISVSLRKACESAAVGENGRLLQLELSPVEA